MLLAAELAERAHAAARSATAQSTTARSTTARRDTARRTAAGATAPAAVRAARRHLTDTVGALIAGHFTLRDRLVPLAGALGLSPGAPGPLPGAADPFPGAADPFPGAADPFPGAADPAPGGSGRAPDAVLRARRVAWLGGGYAHCWELDDIDRASIVCPGCVVLPAVLAALTLRPDASWAEVLGAYLAGYEVALGAAAAAGTGGLITAGWWPTSLFAPAGAAAAVSVLLGHDPEQTTAAIGLAAQQAGGLIAGTNDGRYLQSGVAAERALCAALCAEAGWHGPDDVFDHDRSPLRRARPAADSEPAAQSEPAGDSEPAASPPLIERTSIKAHAAAKHLQAAIDIVLELRATPGWSVEEIVELRCELPHGVARVVDRPAPFRTATGALASAQYVLALAALTGGCYPRHFTADWRTDPELHRLAARVRVAGADDLSAGYPRHWGARVEVVTASGRTGGERLDAFGDPERPIPDSALITKFAGATAPLLPDAEARGLAAALLDEAGDAALARLRAHVLPLLTGEAPPSQERRPTGERPPADDRPPTGHERPTGEQRPTGEESQRRRTG
jgi:2-methylcitrate dehydratase PrpD